MECNKLVEAMEVLKDALLNDDDYRLGWQANIAMAFKDEYYRNSSKYKNQQDIHVIANTAAKNFLALLTMVQDEV